LGKAALYEGPLSGSFAATSPPLRGGEEALTNLFAASAAAVQ